LARLVQKLLKVSRWQPNMAAHKCNPSKGSEWELSLGYLARSCPKNKTKIQDGTSTVLNQVWDCGTRSGHMPVRLALSVGKDEFVFQGCSGSFGCSKNRRFLNLFTGRQCKFPTLTLKINFAGG
jgi:hypothetical protein